MRRIRRIHLVGIGGVGMGGIAEVLMTLGYQVSGSDIQKNAMTERLTKLGIAITYSHILENVANCDAVVVSSAIDPNNIEVVAARKRRIPIVPRAEMLAELMRFKQGIAVAGTHGKTTTTSLIASLFAEANLDPTFVIGGQLNSLGSNAKLGRGEYFIAEADESDASFLHLNPVISVVTNIDREHLNSYDGDFERLKKTFINFIHQLPFYGLAVLCLDCPIIQDLLEKISRPYLTYGFHRAADVRVLTWNPQRGQSRFELLLPGEKTAVTAELNLPGKHNVLNALAAITTAIEAGISWPLIAKGLKLFQGIGRRMQVLGNFNFQGKQILLMDDYGHHPREVRAVIDSVRGGWPNNRLVMLYQPHRYSRTKELFEDFTSILSEVDALIMLEVYAAGEQPILGSDSRTLCGSIRKRGKVDPIFVEDTETMFSVMHGILQDGDILLTQGAGSIGKIAKEIMHFMTAAATEEVIA